MSGTEIQTLLDQLAELARDKSDKGRRFERLIGNYLATDPQYDVASENVWLWSEWPGSWSQDVGIDLVVRETATGDYWAGQCKFFDPANTIDKPHIDSFLSASGKQFEAADGSQQHFTQRLVVSTTDKWNRNAEKAIAGQNIPVARIGVSDLANSPIDWSQFTPAQPDRISRKPRKTSRPHQEEAINLGFLASRGSYNLDN